MIREAQYKTLSLKRHKKNWALSRPNVCQFELTFGCGLHCRHCYTDCYNKPALLKDELNTRDVKILLDKIYDAGVIWVCFTGGDPLIRADFLEIYDYAKRKGFIVTLFTSGHSMTGKIARYLAKKPPFVIEMTLNAVTEERYEHIAQVAGSFSRAMLGIELMREAKLPLKIKTQVTRDNFEEVSKIKIFLRARGFKFHPNTDIFARLNGDTTPCALRLLPEEVLTFNGAAMSDCRNETEQPDARLTMPEKSRLNGNLFRCAAGGGDGIHVDPYGKAFLCNLIRKPAYNLLKVGIAAARTQLLTWVRDKSFTKASQCRDCNVRAYCRTCPGRAYVETGDMEAPVTYYCELSKCILQAARSQSGN